MLLVEIEEELRRARQEAVGAMRAAGISDARIGAALGVSKQAVQKRWPRDNAELSADGVRGDAD